MSSAYVAVFFAITVIGGKLMTKKKCRVIKRDSPVASYPTVYSKVWLLQ